MKEVTRYYLVRTNASNDTEKMIIEKIATEVNTIGTWLFE